MAGNKLTLKKARAKNFRSIGNMWLEIDYLASPSTLIVSESNGSGKSTLSIWALYFVLFGEPYSKDCKIGGLVNSKSGKDCLVELEFNTLGSDWVVKRGYKPAVFEIWKDGKLVGNESAKSDTQAYLQSIIGMDKKAFSNIVALGVDRFVPFIQMGAPERRAFVEQMLDLIVISQMNTITKDKVKAIRKALEQVNYDMGILESKYSGHIRTLGILEQKQAQRLAETGSELAGFEAEETKVVGMINLADEKINGLMEKIDRDGNQKLEKIKAMQSRFRSKMEEIKRGSDSVESLHDCPTCKQGVTEAHKLLIRTAAEAEASKLLGPLQKLKDELDSAQAVVDSNLKLAEEIQRVKMLKVQLEAKLTGLATNIKNIKAKMVDSNEDDQIIAEKDIAGKVQIDVVAKNQEAAAFNKDESTHMQLLQMLKDEGIKASIVSQYIPRLNQSINVILDQLNLYVQINIDSEFNVSMFAPDRKGQTLGNLSTGQLRRIDLAVLLAWRDIAKNKASVDCNVLVLDEILENLSATGVEEFMDMWEGMGSETNLFVISQRAAEFDQYFERTIKYGLKQDMTIEI